VLRTALILLAISAAAPANAAESALKLPDDWCAERPELRQLLPPGDIVLHGQNWNLTYGVEHQCEAHFEVKSIDDALDAIIAGAKKLQIKLTADDKGTIRGNAKDVEIYMRPEDMLGEINIIFTITHPTTDAAQATAFAKGSPELANVLAQLPAGAALRRAQVSHEVNGPVRSQMTLTLPAANRKPAAAWLKTLGLVSDKTGGFVSKEPKKAAALFSDDVHAKKQLELTIWFNPI